MVTTHPIDYGPEPSVSELQAQVFRLEGEIERLRAALDGREATREPINQAASPTSFAYPRIEGQAVTELTQAQIEAAAKAIDEEAFFAPDDLTPSERMYWKANKPNRQALAEERAKAALTAAADPALRDFITDTPISEPNDGWAGEVGWDNFPFTERDKRIAEHVKSEAIERCAQVAEWEGYATVGRQIAAAIRKLKDDA